MNKKEQVMNREERVRLANSYIVGYANDFITDEECNDMIDLTLNEILFGIIHLMKSLRLQVK